MAIDLNDPTTWDVDDKELMEVAKTGVIEDVTPEAPAETTPETIPELVENIPIQAADGKNTIPYSVLKDAREDARTAKAELQRMQRELDELRAQPVAPAPVAAPVAQPAPTAELPEDVKQHLEKIKENWGEDIAAQAERTYWLEQHALYQQQVIDQLTQHVQDQKKAAEQAAEHQNRTETEQIEDAIAASPKLNAWAVAEDQTWFDRATELHATLLRVDRSYAAASWFDKMRVLPDKVEALFGASFEKVDMSQAQQRVKATLDMPPTSLSEMSGGTPPERSEVQKLEDLDGNALTTYMNKLASDPKKFESYLRSFG
jgi:hypothetical protein